MIVYLAQDIPPFVMYCVYGESGSSLLIESIDYDISKEWRCNKDLCGVGSFKIERVIR